MSKISKDLDDLLLHYGVKGMKWREHKLQDLSISEDVGAGGSGGSTDPLQKSKDDLAKTEAQLDEIGAKIADVKSKVGNGPLDMLMYILTGKTKKPDKSKEKNKGNVIDMDALGKKIKDVKSIVGKDHLDMLKYIFTGKKKIQHSGVKGMKWGVHKDYGRNEKPLPKSKIGKKIHSLNRERHWNSVLKEMDYLSNEHLTSIERRVSLENSLKALSKSKVATKQDKEDYLRRSHMTNEELSSKVVRLRVKESLYKAVKSASKEQRAFGQKVVNVGSSLGVRFVINKGKLQMDDVLGALGDHKKNAKSEITKIGREHLAKRGKEIIAKSKTKAGA